MRRSTRNVTNTRYRFQDHWLSVLPDFCERTLKSLLPEIREYAIDLLLRDSKDFRMQYCMSGLSTISNRSLRNIKIGMAGYKLAIAAKSKEIDFESLGVLLVELSPILWSTMLRDTALDTLRTEIEERFGEKIEEVRQIVDELQNDTEPARTRSGTNISLMRRLREKKLRIPNWTAPRLASYCH